jgi:hypothetical protein
MGLNGPMRGVVMRAGQGPGMLGDSEENIYGRNALQEGRAANAIRQQTVDAQPRGAGVVVPQGPLSTSEGRMTEALSLMDRAANTSNIYDASAMRQKAAMLMDGAGLASSEERTAMGERGANDRASLEAQIEGPYRSKMGEAAMQQAQAQAEYYATQLRDKGRIDPADQLSFAEQLDQYRMMRDTIPAGPQRDSADAMYGGIYAQLFPQEARAMLANGTQLFANGGDVQSYAEGGLVDAPMSAMTATPMMTPQMPLREDMAKFQQLQQGLSAMGLTPIDFDTYMSMKSQPAPGQATQNPQAGVMGFSEGGEVPDASGKMVVDTDPNAQTDSIPAMIDGRQPAALDSGEFVIPKDVVLYYGTDKLKKMIAKARQPEAEGQGNGNESVSEYESPGFSAIQAALGS